jgi:hypothetical protein
MKTKTCILAILLAGGLNNSHAQDTWTQKADFGGIARFGAAGFAIGSKGYLGTGNDFNNLYNDFWEYDPSTDAWVQKAGTVVASWVRVGFSIGSKGYLGTGWDGSYTNTFFEYDSTTNSWTQKANFGGTARQFAVGFSIGSKGYIGTGGGSFPTKDFWEYDPSTNVWTRKADFGGVARSNAVGFSIDSKGYIGTGFDDVSFYKDFWEYDPSTNAWTQKADFGGTARTRAVGFAIGSKGYLGTGNDVLNGNGFRKDFWEYDPATNAWTQRADFGGAARFFATGFSIGSKGYVGTGWDLAVNYKDFWEYTPATAQTPGTWAATGSMSIGRQYFTATLLTNGNVLVAGGRDASGVTTSSAELYDPSTGRWVMTGAMTTPREQHTATLLPDGNVLVAGGANTTGATSSAELYDAGTGLWTPTGIMDTPRTAHMATLITTGNLSGMVIVAGGSSMCGGCTPILDSAELYDPSTGLWTDTGSMTIGRYWDDPSPATLADGSILIVGGTTCCPYHWFNEAELFDPVSQTWTPTSSKMTHANERTILLPNNLLLVAGGVSGTQPTAIYVAAAELFDVTTGTWTATASMSTDRDVHTLTLLANGQPLVAGGVSGGWGVCNDLTSAELYDSSAGTWSLTGNMTTARHFHTATLLPNGQVLAAGGLDCEGNVRSSAELYTPPSATTSYRDVILADNPIMYWRLGETSGTIAYDESANHRDASYINNPLLGFRGAIANDTNTSVGFNGFNQWVGWIPTSSYFGAFTVEAWVKEKQIRPVETFFDTRTKTAEFSFDFKFDTLAGKEIHFDVGDGTKWLSTSSVPFDFKRNVWYYIAAVVTRRGATYYVDGSAIGSVTYRGIPLLFDATHKVEVGTNTRYDSEWFDGAIDEVAVYDYALTADQIAAHYATGTGN